MKTERVSLSGNDKIGFISSLTTMLGAGIPILETVDSLLEDAKGGQKKLLETMRADLTQGQHIYFTFAKFPLIFDKVTINIIRAAEEAGTLDVTLTDVKNNIQKEMEFTDRIRSALIYPMFIAFIFVAVLLMILIVVVPKISTVFVQLKVKLPLPTKILIFLSNMLLNYTIPVIIGFIVFTILAIYIYKREKGFIIQTLTSLPVISNLMKEIDWNRFTRSMFLLLSAGIPITSALEMTQDVVTRKEIKKAIKHASDVVFTGKKLSEGLKDEKNVISPIVIRIIEAGEKTGSLDKAMQDAADFLEYQISGNLKAATALIEPMMLVIVGVLIGGMMIAIIGPIYSMIGQISP